MLCKRTGQLQLSCAASFVIDRAETLQNAFHRMSSIERVMGASPLVGGLRGSTIGAGCPKTEKGSGVNDVALGENKSAVGVGGDCTNRIPAKPLTSCRGFVVMVSTRGESKASPSENVGAATVVALQVEDSVPSCC